MLCFHMYKFVHLYIGKTYDNEIILIKNNISQFITFLKDFVEYYYTLNPLIRQLLSIIC